MFSGVLFVIPQPHRAGHRGFGITRISSPGQAKAPDGCRQLGELWRSLGQKDASSDEPTQLSSWCPEESQWDSELRITFCQI